MLPEKTTKGPEVTQFTSGPLYRHLLFLGTIVPFFQEQ